MRRIFDYWITYWCSMLTVLFALAYASGARISINLLTESLGIPAWIFIVLFAISTVLNSVLRIHWKYHALILSPFVVYGILSIFAYAIAGQSLITGLISGHLYGGFVVTFILYLAARQDNQALRHEQMNMIAQIESYRHELGLIGNHATNSD